MKIAVVSMKFRDNITREGERKKLRKLEE